MGKSIKIDTDIWDLIVTHYTTINNPTDEDRRVMKYIVDKEGRRASREDFLDSRARYARMRDWEEKTPEQ